MGQEKAECACAEAMAAVSHHSFRDGLRRYACENYRLSRLLLTENADKSSPCCNIRLCGFGI